MCTSAEGWGLVHHGLLHPSSADVADILTPLIAERLARREPVLAALPPTIAARLRNRLPTTAGLHTTDVGGLYRHPGRVLGHYLGWVADTSPDGAATIVAAPQLDDDPHRAALWMHVDALITQALAECALTLVCAYPHNPATAAAICHAHPSLLNGAATANPDHLPADQFLAHHPLPPPSELGQPDATHILDHPSQLTELRKVVGSHAAHAGLTISRCEDFVLAVSEVAGNALEHGVPPAAASKLLSSRVAGSALPVHSSCTTVAAGLAVPSVR